MLWSRNKIFGGDFNAADGADNSNDVTQVPTATKFGLKFSNIVDITLNRSKLFATTIYKVLQAGLHKTEDRATAANIGATIESTQEVYVTPEQLPTLTPVANDFTVTTIPSDGTLSDNIVPLRITPVTTGKNIQYQVNFSDRFLKLFIARTEVTATQNYYVDGNEGDDEFGDGSILHPFATPQWAAHKARIYSFDTDNPVTITVFGSNYSVLDTQTINDETVVGNLWIYGGWDFKAGVFISFDSTSGTYLFNSTTIPTDQRIGNMVVKGSLILTSSNGGCIEHKSVAFTNYQLDFEWLESTTLKEFLFIDKTSPTEYIPVNLKNGKSLTTSTTLSCIKAINRPVIFADNCYFSNNPSTSVPEIDFNAVGVDMIGIYCIFNNCQIGNTGNGGQVRVGRNSNILDFVNCEWFGPSTATRDCIRLESASLASVGTYPIRLIKNYVTRRAVNGVTPTLINFINAIESANIVAVDNDCNAARLTAASGKTLTTLSLNSTTYASARTVTATSYPSALAVSADGVFTPAYNFWI